MGSEMCIRDSTAATVLGGGGGGKPDVAQGGGSDAARIPDALAAVRRQIQDCAS